MKIKYALIIILSIAWLNTKGQETPWIRFNNVIIGSGEGISGLQLRNDLILLTGSNLCQFDSSKTCPTFKNYNQNGDYIDSMTVSSLFEGGSVFVKANASQSRKLKNDLVANFFSYFQLGQNQQAIILVSNFELNIIDTIVLKDLNQNYVPPYDAAILNDSVLLIYGYRFKSKIENGTHYFCQYNSNTGSTIFNDIQDGFKYYELESAHFDVKNESDILLSVDATPEDMDFFNYVHYVMKVNVEGELQWIFCDSIFNGPSILAKGEILRLKNENSVHSIRNRDGNVAIGNSGTLTGLRCLSPDGEHLWDTFFNDSCVCRTQSNGGICVRQNGDIIGTGHYKKINVMPFGSPYQIWIYCVSPTGSVKWSKRYAYEKVYTSNKPLPVITFFQGENIKESESKFIYVNGSASFPEGDNGNFIMKVDSMGCFTPGCTSDDVYLGADPTSTVEEEKLREVFYKIGPNPFSSELNIEMLNPQPGRKMEMLLFDLNGKMVSVLNGLNTIGMYQMNTENLSSGIYLLNLLMEGRVIQVDKVVKM